MEEENFIYFADLAGWRNWLQENHTTKDYVWLVYYKVHTGKPCVSYNDSVEEALCYGWIDSLIKKLDEDRYARKFTPRRPGSHWSSSNKQRVRKLIRERRMHPVGMAVVEFPIEDVDDDATQVHRETTLPDDLLRMLQADTQVWKIFNQLPPSHKRNFIGWILSAKKDETRRRRLNEAIILLSQGKRLGMK